MSNIFSTINSLEEFSLIAGNTYTLEFTVTNELGTAVDISTSTVLWRLSQFGNPEYEVLEIAGVITGTNTFEVVLENHHTKELSGTYIHQPVLVAGLTEEFIPSQGKIIILPQTPTTLLSEISSWQTTGSNVHVGGINTSDFVLSSSAGDATFLNVYSGILQDGTINQIRLSVNTTAGGTWKFKIFRYNTDTELFDLVTEQPFIPAGTGTQTITLNPPISVQMGDTPGIYTPNASEKINTTLVTVPGGYTGIRYVNSTDVTTSNAFSTTSLRELNLDCLGNRPYLAVTGDSITAGSANSASPWNNIFAIGAGTLTPTVNQPGGNPESEIANMIKEIIPSIQYQNLARGGETWAWALSTGVPACLLTDPRVIYLAFGLNDIKVPRTWNQVLADMDAIRLLIPSTIKLMIQEIIPATYLTNTQAGTSRTWNANYLTWCNSNNATLVMAHDRMGKIRPATGALDDLISAYDYDGRHLTTDGVSKMATLIAPYF